MTRSRAFFAFTLALLAAGLVGCGGGGGGGGGSDGAVIPPPGGGGGGGGGTAETPPGEYVVVQYDHDGDGNLDLVTLDKTETPFQVVEILLGTADGDSVDATKALAGQAIDAQVSDALSTFLADSFEVASERELEATDALGNSVTLTVYE